MSCSKCGSEVTNGGFCANCGALVGEDNQQLQPGEHPSDNQQLTSGKQLSDNQKHQPQTGQLQQQHGFQSQSAPSYQQQQQSGFQPQSALYNQQQQKLGNQPQQVSGHQEQQAHQGYQQQPAPRGYQQQPAPDFQHHQQSSLQSQPNPASQQSQSRHDYQQQPSPDYQKPQMNPDYRQQTYQGVQPQPLAGSRPQPSVGSRLQPLAGSRPQPPIGPHPQPPIGPHSQPPIGARPQPPIGSHPQPPVGARPQPPTGYRPLPQAGSQPQPPAGYQQQNQSFQQQPPGHEQSPPGYQQQPFSEGDYQSAAHVTDAQYVPGSFVEGLHNHGRSSLFLVGIILFSVGSLINVLISFKPLSIISLLMLALPIIAFWLIFAASNSPKLPEKTLPALTMFKVYIIITMVFMCLVALLMLIASLGIFVAAGTTSNSYNPDGAGVLMAVGFFVLLLGGVLAVFMVIYYRALFRLIGGIRNGITYDTYTPLTPLPGVKIFSILAYISVGFTVLSTIISNVAVRNIGSFARQIPPDMRAMLEPYMDSMSNNTFSTIFNLMTSAGIILCIVVLNKFNNSLAGDGLDKMKV